MTHTCAETHAELEAYLQPIDPADTDLVAFREAVFGAAEARCDASADALAGTPNSKNNCYQVLDASSPIWTKGENEVCPVAKGFNAAPPDHWSSHYRLAAVIAQTSVGTYEIDRAFYEDVLDNPWNRCEAQVAEPAAFGDSCEQGPGDPRACEAGSRCVGGLCIAECDATQPCPDDQACARERVCGSRCELLAQACGEGWSCTPSADLRDTRDGWGVCVPAGTVKARQPCDREGLECEAGLTCQTANALGETHCLPYCAHSTECIGQLDYCDSLLDGVAGYCRGG